MNIIKKIYDNDRQLKIIYIVAVSISSVMYFLCPRIDFLDTETYLQAKDMLLQNGEFDHFRTPLYPLFLAITHYPFIALVAQNIIFLFSVRFLYKTLKMITDSLRLVFIFSLIYVIHPTFIFYNYQLLSESLSISLSAIYIYFLISYLKNGKTSHCWIFHFIMLLLIFIKPVFVFLLGISFGLLIYLFLFKRISFRPLILFVIAFLVQVSIVGGYMSIMDKKYGVFSISSVSDANFYWMLEEAGLLDFSTLPDEEAKKPDYYSVDRLRYIAGEYGWKEVHSIVRKNLQKSYKTFLFGKSTSQIRAINFTTAFTHTSGKSFWKILSMSLGFTFYQLFVLFGLYFFLILKTWIKSRKIPIISLTLSVYLLANFIVLYLTAMNDYSRLITPSLVAILIMFMQLSNRIIEIFKNPNSSNHQEIGMI
jgi:hypothetical protein